MAGPRMRAAWVRLGAVAHPARHVVLRAGLLALLLQMTMPLLALADEQAGQTVPTHVRAPEGGNGQAADA